MKSSEIDLFKLILNKFILDEKYKSPKIKKVFLYLAKVIISNKKIKDFIHNENFLNFLSNNINDSNNIMEIITNQANKIFNLNLVQRFSIEILIVYLLKSEKEDPFLKSFAEKLIITLNTEYNSNNLFHYNNLIFKQIFNTPSASNLIFDRNNPQNLIDIYNFINIQNNSTLILTANPNKNTSLILFDLIFPKYHLIKLYKTFLKIFFEKKFSQTIFIINMIKDLIQNQLALYSGGASAAGKAATAVKSDSLTNSEETKDDLVKNLPLLGIRNLDKTLHVNLKIFLIKSLTNCLKITLFNISKISQTTNSNNNNINSSQRYLEFLNHFISIAMVLILSEECWDIKVNGVNLLIEIIKRFSKIKDDRVDDNSLLIQQYEAQISSCIKMIFGNNFSIESLFKGMDLLYSYVCIPITTDYSYVKRIESFIDIDLHKNNPGTIFSEKYDHFFITKKLKFFCRLYMTSLLSKNKMAALGVNNPIISSGFSENLKSICVFNSDVSELDIYGETLETTKYLVEYFDLNLGKFFKNLFDMLSDFNIILNSDPKFAKNYKSYEFLASGNRIAYSYKKVHKYSQIYLKILSLILLDKRTKADGFLENLVIKSKKNLKISEINFDSICEILLYHINHFSTKNSQNMELNMVCICDFNIFSDSDITFDLKEKLILNAIKITEMFEILNQILLSEAIISKKVFLNILNYCFFLVNFAIKEFYEKIFSIVEIVIRKLIEKQSQNKSKYNNPINTEKTENSANNDTDFILTNEEKNSLMQNLTKFCFNYFSKNERNNPKGFFAEKNCLFLSKIIEIVSNTANLILNEINFSNLTSLEISHLKSEELDNLNNLTNFLQGKVYSESAILNDFLVLCKIQFELFKNSNSQQTCKLSAAKLFGLLSSFHNLKVLKLFYDMLFTNLNSLNQFDRYFILYYMILQNVSKRLVQNKNMQEELNKMSSSISSSNNDKIESNNNDNNYNEAKFRELENEINSNNELIEFTKFILIKDFKAKVNSEQISLAESSSEAKEKITLLIKSLSFACNSNFDDVFKSFFENILFYSLENAKVFMSLLSHEEFQTMLLTFTLNIESEEKRKNLIFILLFMLNEKAIISSPSEITRLALISLKLISKDLELIGAIAQLLDRNFVLQINNLAIMQRNQMMNQAQQQQSNQNSSQAIKSENDNKAQGAIECSDAPKNLNLDKNEKREISANVNEEANLDNKEKKKSEGPKLKALKFGK